MKKICFDYGHGGRDPGAVYKGRMEKNDVLKVGRMVAKRLREEGVQVDETRISDMNLSLKARSDIERAGKYDFFISFHRNAFRPEKARGAETFIYLNSTKKAKDLAEEIQKGLESLGFRNRGVKRANFYVLRETRAPALLVELGFIDNSMDNRLFDKNLGRISSEISAAILGALGLEGKSQSYKDLKKTGKEEGSGKETYYRVMAGSFKSRDNARKRIEELRQAGFQSIIMVYEK